MWRVVILLLSAVAHLDGRVGVPWGDRPLFPSDRIPQDALDPLKSPNVRRKIVLYHNLFRTKVKPTASNMLLMRWHSGAAAQAQRYAAQCVYLEHNDFQERRVASLGACGQNLFVSSKKTPWFFAIKSWFLEYRNFTYGAPIADLKAVGHYTQMAWATSHAVGCGVHRCRGGPWGQFYNYVCHYCPGGNFETTTQYPYKIGLPCEDCPLSCVANLLCSNSCPKIDRYRNCQQLTRIPGICQGGACNATCECGSKKLHKNFPW